MFSQEYIILRKKFTEQLERINMTREEELNILKEYIEENGITKLPPDVRGPEMMFSAWTRSAKKKKKVEKKKAS